MQNDEFVPLYGEFVPLKSDMTNIFPLIAENVASAFEMIP